jgi:hypothetical protein
MDERIQQMIKQSKELKAKMNKPFTHEDLIKCKGFEDLSEETAIEVLDQMKEYVEIVLIQMNRLGLLDADKVKKDSERCYFDCAVL